MKKTISVGLLIVALCAALIGCKSSLPASTAPQATAPVETTQPTETVAASISDFQNLNWTRDTETCIETLCFRGDGSCSYTCACGNPVNDDDLCEGYRYEADSKTIFLEFLETTEETVSQITVKSCDGKTLVLDFDGDVRTFQLEEEAD